MSLEQLVTSRANPRYKTIRQLVANSGMKRTHTLLLGAKLIQSWWDSPHRTRVTPELLLRLEGGAEEPLPRIGAVDTLQLSDALMRDLSDSHSPPAFCLLVRLAPDPEGPLADRVIAPWGIQDPGNLGAILRSAAAFGFQEALLGPGCADPFSPKSLRGSMGAAFLLQVRRSGQFLDDGSRWWALDGGREAVTLPEADLSSPVRILVGNEGHGWRHAELPVHVRRLAIPTQGVESLNAAVAAGIACHEACRRNRW